MGAVFNLLHESGVTQEILSIMASLRLIEEMETLLQKAVTDLYATIIIISDSNSVFIDHILKEKGLSNLIEKVFTNPARWQGGKLCIEPFHHQEVCKLSNVNLCKGQVMEEFLAECRKKNRRFSFIGYVGDGKNDFCPGLRLSESDVLFVREGYTLQNVIKEDEENKVKSDVCYWTSGKTILAKLKEKSNQT